MISAKIIADSKNEFGNRLTTFVLTFPRIVLAEFNTHRMVSKNSASSRAIPFKKMVQMVQENPFIPIKWMKDHPGMQGNEYFTDAEVLELDLVEDHLLARDKAVEQAVKQNNKGVTKQICNRYLEPFMWHTVIATGTEWQNFFALRANKQAEIHIQELAYQMLDAYNASTPKQLKAGEWHIPFGDTFDEERFIRFTAEQFDKSDSNDSIGFAESIAVKIATARCARISYNNFEGKDDYEADIKLYDKLATSGHYSPFEHCAKAMSVNDYNEYRVFLNPDNHKPPYVQFGWCGNFRGFVQVRKTLQEENKTDNRIVAK